MLQMKTSEVTQLSWHDQRWLSESRVSDMNKRQIFHELGRWQGVSSRKIIAVANRNATLFYQTYERPGSRLETYAPDLINNSDLVLCRAI